MPCGTATPPQFPAAAERPVEQHQRLARLAARVGDRALLVEQLPLRVEHVLEADQAVLVEAGRQPQRLARGLGRQLDGVLSSARALPAIADAVKGQIKILADSGIRNGLDVVRAIALGADCAMIGRAFIYALAAAGEAGVKHLLELLEKEMRVAMTLTSVSKVADITGDLLVREA